MRSHTKRAGRLRESPAVWLFLLAPLIGELLSSSSPFPGFLIAWLPLGVLYGCGALLIREAKVRRGLAWPAVFALGAAYGILEEGIVVRSFFDPGWEDLGLLAEYGRAAGVNWTWAHLLTLFHASVSIAVPILAVELTFPQRRHEPWLQRRGILWCLGGLAAWVLVADAAFMDASGQLLVASWVAIALLVGVGLKARTKTRAPREVIPRPARYFALTAVVAFVTFVIPHAAAEAGTASAVAPSIGMTVVLMLGLLVWDRWSDRGSAWTDPDRAAVVGGALACLGLLVALTGNPVTIATSVASIWVWARWFRTVSRRAVRQEVLV